MEEQEPVQADDSSFELGDTVHILGGQLDGTRGRIYYLDETLLRILPTGVTDRLIDIPIIDGDFDPSLEIEQCFNIEKHTNPAFVAQIDAHVGQIAQTFNSAGTPGPTYKIKAINETTDSIVLEDEVGGELPVEFDFNGIPLDMPFAVIRPRQVVEADDMPLSEVDQAQAAATAAAEAQAEQEQEDIFEDVIDAEVAADKFGVGGIREVPASDRSYDDASQRSDMLREMIESLDSASQKNPVNQTKIRLLVEQCILLRNSLVAYSASNQPAGQLETSFPTLYDLVKNSTIPLSRPVLQAKRTLYLDHTPATLLAMSHGNPSTDPIEVPGTDIDVQYLEDTVKQTIHYMETQLGGIQSQIREDALPNWFLSWETLNKQLHSTWASNGDLDTITFTTDKEFLRGPVSDIEIPEVDGLPVTDADRDTLLTSASVQKIGTSLLRGLGPRSTRLREKDTDTRRIESPEEGSLMNTLLFPLSEQGNLGSIRSGKLANDMAYSHQPTTQTISQIIERLEGIPEVPTAGKIVSVGVGGNTLGNIPLEEWLKAQPLYPLGLADVLVVLANYGMAQAEFNVDQQAVLIDKIQGYRALIKQFITEIRASSTKALSELTVQQNPLLEEENFAEILKLLRGEPLLATRMDELRAATPVYKESDIAVFAGLMQSYSDLVLTVLAKVPGPLARERNRRVKDQFLEALRNSMLKATVSEMSGEIPVPNDCPHVASYAGIMKVKDDSQRMQLFARFLARFKNGREDNWDTCGVCNQHLACYHEDLLLQEFKFPREKDTIHKELLLTFSGGQFHGKYMCKNCGQGISSLEFDTNLEFSDSGAPMSGRAILDTGNKDADEIDVVLNPTGGNDLEFKSDTQTTIYNVARKLFDMVGINADETAYKNIVQRVESEILKQPSREDYQRRTKGTRAMDYDILLNRILIGSTGAFALIEIQTHIPGYIMRYKLPGCRAGFSGYPMGKDTDKTGVEYIACAIAAVNDNMAPWNLTGFQRESDKKRKESVLTIVSKLLEAALTNASVQQQLAVKRAQLTALYGSAVLSEQLPEQIPPSFAPALYVLTEENKTIVIPEAASVPERVRGWILQAHTLTKDNGTYVKGNSFAEATCCLAPIQKPGEFWKAKASTMAELPLKDAPRGPIRSHLGLHLKLRPQETLEGTISPDVMYRIFLKVCYKGDRLGLPHEPGYTNTCANCGFVFPDNPYTPTPFPPISADSKTQKEQTKAYLEEVDAIITKGKVALESQRIPITPSTFEEVLDASHRAFHVDPPKRKEPIAGMRLFDLFRTLNPAPHDGWREGMAATIEQLAKLPANPNEVDFAETYGPVSNIAVDLIADFKARLGTENGAALQKVLESSPAQLVETVRTYFLIPFQRLVTGYHVKSLRVQKSYNLGTGTEDDLNRILDTHLDYMSILVKRATGLTRAKLTWAAARLAAALALLKTSMRGSYIPGGGIGLPYVTTALVGGILSEFINPNFVPPGTVDGGAAVDLGARAPIQILDICIQKIRLEGLNFTEDQIREMINKRTDIEKSSYIGRFEKLTPEEKAVEKMKKNLGLGEWAVGGTKAIIAYNPEQYEREREQRLVMGFTDFLQPGAVTMQDEPPGALVQEDGYENAQVQEDDY